MTETFPAAGVPVGKQYALTAGPVALAASTILNNTWVPAKLTVKNGDSAAAKCYLGGPGVANTPAGAFVELGAGDSYTFTNQHPASIFIVGTVGATNIAFIVAEYY